MFWIGMMRMPLLFVVGTSRPQQLDSDCFWINNLKDTQMDMLTVQVFQCHSLKARDDINSYKSSILPPF